ncbi:hypothetical protein [Pseudomonas sp. Leaf127]|nr:hypothetical protein [Pseudomonas sp. Leaf127]
MKWWVLILCLLPYSAASAQGWRVPVEAPAPVYPAQLIEATMPARCEPG